MATDTRHRRALRGIGIALLAASLAVGTLTVSFLRSSAPGHDKTTAEPAMARSAPTVSSGSADPLLVLVSSSHPLAANYSLTLAAVNIAYYCSPDKDNRMDSRAVPYVEKMVAASRRAGASVVLVSGYRSHDYQQQNFDRSVSRLMAQGETADAASTATAASIAVPGTSEHETGLAMDVCSAGWFVHNSDLNAGFDQTAAFRWLSAHAAEYGFILRYPKDKNAVTGIIYEPWHYRFVGPENAEKIVRSGLCLEEYLDRGAGR